MTTDFEVLRAAILAMLPGAYFDVMHGEVIIYTGLAVNAEGNLVPYEHED